MHNLNERARSFCWTLNNYSERSIPSIDVLGARYLCFGREIGPVNGVPHLQGYAYFANARTLRSVIGKLPGAHVEVARGNHTQNVDYCSKDRDFSEFGDRPSDDADRGDEEKARWERTLVSAKKGALEEIDPDILIRNYSALRRIKNDFKPKVVALSARCGLWIHGKSGAGKSHSVEAMFPDHYKKGHNKWWDGYDGEEVAYLDDLGLGDKWLGDFYLKHWADKWPFQAECKGFSTRLRPGRFVVTSQYRIVDIWEDEETRDALQGRFTIVEKLRDLDIVL